MRFKDFITRQRIIIFVAGVLVFILSIIIAHVYGASTLPGDLFGNLAASAITVIFTALIIEYLGVKEESIKTQSAAELAEDEIRAACFRIKLRMAYLFGLERQEHRSQQRSKISSREEAAAYLASMTTEVDDFLEGIDMVSEGTAVDESRLGRYLERLQQAQTDLEQTLLLYEYALPYTLRERILALRQELLTADRVLSFGDVNNLNDANVSLLRVMSKSIYELIQDVLGHNSRSSSIPTIQERGQ